ncbi:MAG: hypothetical protein AB1777_12910, partial [Bacteroidota bacterium]
TRALADGGTNEIVIGASTTGFGSNSAAYGNSSITKHIFQAGNIGIGTTSPGAKLDVNGSSNLGGDVTISASNASLYMQTSVAPGIGIDVMRFKSYDFIFGRDGGWYLNDTVLVSGNSNIRIMTNPTSGIIQFGKSSGDGNYYLATEWMRIANSGNVGIGTTSPSKKLDVIGDGINLENTSSNATGIIWKNGISFLHNYSATGHDGYNTFLGLNAGNFTMTGVETYDASYNTAVGTYALNSNTDGNSNTALGAEALRYNTNGYSNTALGYIALKNTTSGYRNTAVGSYALLNNIVGSNNIALGRSAGLNSTGSNNVFLGAYAGDNLTAGDNNIIIGANLDFASSNASNQLNIGGVIFGNLSSGNIGIGTTSPGAKLAVVPSSSSDVVFQTKSLQSTAPLGSELVTNGDFATSGSWTWGTGWSHDATNLEADHTSGNTAALTQSISVTNGTTYQVSITIRNLTAGSVSFNVNGVYIYNYGSTSALNSNDTYTRSFVANATGTVT